MRVLPNAFAVLVIIALLYAAAYVDSTTIGFMP